MWTALAVIFGIGGVFAGIVILGGFGGAFEGTLCSAPFGWVVPIVASAIIGGVVWSLAGERGKGEGAASSGMSSVACPDCGRQVMGEWRICPYCAAMLARRAAKGRDES